MLSPEGLEQIERKVARRGLADHIEAQKLIDTVHETWSNLAAEKVGNEFRDNTIASLRQKVKDLEDELEKLENNGTDQQAAHELGKHSGRQDS
jgi:hypothetical protein